MKDILIQFHLLDSKIMPQFSSFLLLGKKDITINKGRIYVISQTFALNFSSTQKPIEKSEFITHY
jgi:hypothetical protein